ncbi:MAG: phosphoglucosamine mutase [Bacteroidales bacterium]
MTLIKSISGIRGTIGGRMGEDLTPLDIVKFSCAFADFLKTQNQKTHLRMVVGRDARISGEMINHLVVGSLMGMGVDVIDTGLSTTPTVEMAVIDTKADGGIILTASHNPKQWNALKLLNCKGEFINAAEGQEVICRSESSDLLFSQVDSLGSYIYDNTTIDKHIASVLALKYVDVPAIRAADFKVVVDAVNSTGGIAIPRLLKALGVEKITELYCEPTGLFPHNPEPLPENLKDLSRKVVETSAHLGIAVDPDVDRLALVCENGEMFGEEYTLVACADYILGKEKGATVSNLSSSRALEDVTLSHACSYSTAAVGEVNVVAQMRATHAIIGGEGNGGVIYPSLHAGRDALVGIALFLTHLAYKLKEGLPSVSALRASYPAYTISKNKIELLPSMDVDAILSTIQQKYKDKKIHTIDGVKIEFDKEWVHLRKSNTEPIIRIYAESTTPQLAEALAQRFIGELKLIANLK